MEILCFNGAADDLDGSTSDRARQTDFARQLQWGRRRSRRINNISIIFNHGYVLASMGPPAISADQHPRWSNPRGIRWTCFNGAADVLGGSTA